MYFQISNIKYIIIIHYFKGNYLKVKNRSEFNFCINLMTKNINILNLKMKNITKSLGIGDWGLGIGPNPQSPIPNPHR